MDNLIDTFKTDHQNILNGLERIKNIGTDYSSMSSALSDMKETFLAHMGLEDAEFYVKLRRRVKLSLDLLRTLDFLIKDLEELKITSLVFFEKYTNQELESLAREFAQDFHGFYDKIVRRIDLEENQLFPLFGKYIREISG